MLFDFIEWIARIWTTDTEIRDQNALGESDFDRKGRRIVALICGGSIIIVILAAVLWALLREGP